MRISKKLSKKFFRKRRNNGAVKDFCAYKSSDKRSLFRRALMVKRLRRSPLTAETGVRFPVGVPKQKDGQSTILLFCYPTGWSEHLRMQIVRLCHRNGSGDASPWGCLFCLLSLAKNSTTQKTLAGSQGFFIFFYSIFLTLLRTRCMGQAFR